MDKRFWGVIAAIAIIFVGIVVINNNRASAPNDGNGQLSNHVKGDNAKKVSLVEYGDFQCPACYSFEPVVKQTYEKYKTDISFQFRNFPLQQIHRNAFAASRAAEAAAKQNKFWEMHDLLYQSQDPNGQSGWVASSNPLNDYFVKMAQQLGLNVDTFKTDYASDSVNGTINADIAEGNKLKIDSTPTFFLDGKKIDNAKLLDNGRPTLDKFSQLIDEAIKAKQTAATKQQ